MKLYKYVAMNALSILSERQIKFSPPTAFNDPFEALVNIAALLHEDEIEAFAHEAFEDARKTGVLRGAYDEGLAEAETELGVALTPEQREWLMEMAVPIAEEMARGVWPSISRSMFKLEYVGMRERVIDRLQQKLGETLGVFCLAERPDSLLMWSHYADSHRGMVVEFEATHPFFDQRRSDSDVIRRLKKVNYRAEMPAFPGLSLKEEGNQLANLADLALLTKSKEWEYEQEWRIVLERADATGAGNGTQMSSWLVTVPAEAITGVVIGFRANDLDRGRIQAALEAGGLSHVAPRRAIADTREFRIQLV